MKDFTIVSAFFALTFVTVSTQAQNTGDLTCRSKAKEIAARSYSNCVTEARNMQIDQIRIEYQKQLTDLKAKYDKELKKVNGSVGAISESNEVSKAKTKPARSSVDASTGSAPKPTQGIAKSLPTRTEVKNPAPAANQTNEEFGQNPDPSGPGTDESSSQNDAQGDLSIRLIPSKSLQDATAATLDERVY